MDENDIGKIVVDTAVKIHKVLGPGLLENVYEVVLAKQLRKRGLDVSRQVQIPVVFDGDKFDEGFRADIVVNDIVILELKSVEKVQPLHLNQVKTYLKLSGCRLGFLLNFNVELMKNGIRRCVNRMPD